MKNKGTEIYLDYNASAPIRPEAIDLMTDILKQAGNASSIHSHGRKARNYIESAREQLALLSHTHSNQIIFTGGATEANNTVLSTFNPEEIWISAIEHPSIIEAAPNARLIPVTPDGIVDINKFEFMLDTMKLPALISVMLVNNETGAIQPVEILARMAKSRSPALFFHTDAVQAAGKTILNMPALHVDYMSLSAHKLGGPQGVGALILAPGAPLTKRLVGGGQEKKQRAGTENVAGIAGFGIASELAYKEIEKFQNLALLRDKIEIELKNIAPEIIIFSENAPRVVNTSAISLPGVPAQTQIMALDLEGVSVSSGAACSSGKLQKSPVADAMGVTENILSGAFRVSLGWNSNQEDIHGFLNAWQTMYERTVKKAKSA